MNDVLSRWKEDAKLLAKFDFIAQKRILALIDLVRKKDLKITHALETKCYHCDAGYEEDECICWEIPEMKIKILNEALHLNDELEDK